MTNLQLKRSRSNDNFERPTKLSKIKENIFSFLGFTSSNKKFNKSNDDDDDDDDVEQLKLSSPSSSSTSKTTRLTVVKDVLNHQITAKQLSDYYDQLRRENSTLSSNLSSQRESTPTPAPETEKPKPINDNDTVLSNKAESTVIQNEAKEEKEPQDQEQIVPPLSTSTELSNTNKAYTNTKPLFTIDPLERANLIHLKKMLELEKYRKLRMKYIQEHTRHLKNNVNDKLNYKKSGPNSVNNTSQSRKRNWKDLPEERKNKEGSFGISLIEDVEEDDDEEDEEEEGGNQRNLNNHNLLKKIKFNETDKLGDFDTANRPKSFVPNKENEKKETTHQNINITKPVHKIEPVKGIDAPTIAFDFGKKKEENPKTNNDKIDSQSFKFNALSTEKADRPFFSLGQSTVSSVEAPSSKTEKKSTSSLSFAKPIHTPNTESKPSFSFGSKKSIPSLFPPQAESKVEKPAEMPIKDGEVLNTNPSNTFNFQNNNALPSINFGKPIINQEESKPVVPVSAPSFNFGSSNMGKEVKHSAPSFNFGMSTEKKEGDKQVIPSFNFSKSAGMVNDKPSFSFGQQAAPQKDDGKKVISTPFSFESKPDSPALINSAITFNNNRATVSEQKPEPRPEFSSSTEKKDSPKLAFSFGKNSEASKMDFSFGTSSGFGSDVVAKTGSNSSTPAFNFSASTDKKDDKKPIMAFGSMSATSNTTAFNFGSNKKPVLPSVEKKDETAPLFGFGGPNKPSSFESEDSNGLALKRKKIAQNGSAPPVFNLNASKVQSAAFGTANNTSSLSSTFGAATNSTNNATTGFSFGVSKSASPAPNTANALSSNNGSSKNFSIGQTSTNKSSSTGFGQTKNPGLGFTSSSGTATTFGQNGVSGFANNMNQNQNQVQPQASGKIFSSISSKFTSQLPSITAGFNNNTNNNNSNTGFGSINNGFGGGNNNGFGGNTNSAFGSNTGFGGNTNTGFGANSRSLSGSNSGFGNNNSGFGSSNNGFGANNHINMNTNNMGSASRSATPNIDFTGQQTGQIDPNAIFSGTSSATPPPQNARRKAFPRSMRNRR